MKSNKKNNSSGFTLVELTVSIGIIAIISTMALANFKGHNNKNKVDLAAYKLASDIRRAQSFALSMKEFSIDDVPEGGWGINLSDQGADSDGIYFFADMDNNQKRKGNGDENYGSKVLFQNGVIMKNNGMDIDGGNENTVSVIFVPPNPNTLLCDNSGSCTGEVVTLTLTDADGFYERTVKVNKFGLIDVD